MDTRELWFVLVANPDGYDFTFTPENRLWRKNLRNNDDDPEITAIDGVDPNRNFPTRWAYDDEGSNNERSSETYHGTGPASEPETQALLSLVNRVHFTSNKNDHTFGRLLLWPPGWQVDTRFADEPIMTALAGDDENPAIPGFDPDVGAELYTTNGDTNDHMYQADRVLSFTPEGSPGVGTGSGFIFQDVEADVQEEFEKHVQFALDLARSADSPSRPDSHLGNRVPNFVVDDFPTSYGNPQTVQVNARRDLGKITLRYQVNGGAVQTKPTSEWQGGLRYGDEGDYWYHRMRGVVTGTEAGDSVKVWFTAKGGRASDSFTYEVRSDSNADVLVLAVEDYSGNSAFPPYADPTQPELPRLLHRRAGRHARTTCTTTTRRTARRRDPLGVLSHFDAVIWYTGNDNVTRAGPTPGVADLEAHRTITAVRDFVNEGGRVALQGVNAGRQYDLVEYPQEGFPASTCDGDLLTTDGGKCQPLSNDFAQYYLGSYVRADGGGQDEDGSIFPVHGLTLTAGRLGRDAELRATTAPATTRSLGIETGTHLVTSSILDPAVYPQFASEQAADWVTDGDKPFDPHSGEWYMTSQNINEGYKRLRRTIEVPAGATARPVVLHLVQHGARLGLRVRGGADAERPGRGQRRLGHAARQQRDSSHDQRDRRQLRLGLDGGAAPPPPPLHGPTTPTPTAVRGGCTPTGTTGDWNAATGNSGGWQEWKIDLSAYQGQAVEISIVYATDWGTLTVPGMLVDDTKVTVNGVTTHETDFETDEGGWEIPGAHPEGPSSNLNDWIRSRRIFEDAAVTKSAFGLFFGFGLEGVDGEANRQDLMERTLSYLLAG